MARMAVVIPTYNRAHMLGDALASLAAQDEACEVYVYDDGSTDGTEALVSAHPSVVYARGEHAGITAAFNRAVSLALSRSGAPYIAWLGSDDAYAQGAVRLRADHLDAHPEHGIVCTGLRFVGAHRWGSKRGTDHRIDVGRYAPARLDTFSRNVHTGSRNVHTGTAAFRREAWIPWREECGLGGADLLWLYEQVTRGVRVGYVDATLYYCRKHDGRNIHAWRAADKAEYAAHHERYMGLVEAIAREHGYGG